MSERLDYAVGWFEIGTEDPDTAQRFYGDLFGWTFQQDEDDPMDYRMATTLGMDAPRGGIRGTEGKFPNYAIFYIVVEDVPATVSKAERLGGKTLVPPTDTPNGLVFAQIHDPSGNLIGVFKPPPAA